MKFRLRPKANDKWWQDPGEGEWNPSPQTAADLSVDWEDKSRVFGTLFLPNGQVLELVERPPAFGFGRYAEELEDE